MIGVGPTFLQSLSGDRRSFLGADVVLDFMFWPSRNVGWYLEPGYELVFNKNGTGRGVNLTGGLLIGW